MYPENFNLNKSVFALVFVFAIIAGCSKDLFEGTNDSADDRFILDFESLNSSVSHEIKLNRNDIIDVEITKHKGSIDVLVSDQMGNTLYKGDRVSNSVFSIIITQDSNYTFKVTGRNASGNVSFILRQ